jgi:hypothetical protein
VAGPLSGPDRRHERRRYAAEEHGIVSVRVRPGIQARLLDVSASGALLETTQRLLPGRHVHVQLACPSLATTVRSRVIRCHVHRITAECIRYRCGVRFDRSLQWSVETNGVRYVVVG